jgi:hypothetical protein
MTTTDTAAPLTPGFNDQDQVTTKSAFQEILQYGQFFALEFAGTTANGSFKARLRKHPKTSALIPWGSTVAAVHCSLTSLVERAAGPVPPKPDLLQAAPITKALEKALWTLYGPVGQDTRVHRNDARQLAAYRQLADLGLVSLHATDVPDVYSVERNHYRLKA